jgi:hypothetical protein
VEELISNKTIMANWHELIIIAQKDANIILDCEVEAYVVMVLMNYTSSRNFANIVLSLEYLNTLLITGNHQSKMKSIADQCLLYSGLFPKRSIKKNVPVSYFSSLGQAAYSQLVSYVYRTEPELSCLYEKLSLEFANISDVMVCMRKGEFNRGDC